MPASRSKRRSSRPERRRRSVARQLHSMTSACSRIGRHADCVCTGSAARLAKYQSAVVRGPPEPPRVGNRTLPAESGFLTPKQPTGTPAPRKRACPAAQIQLGRTPTARGLGCDGFEREHGARCSEGHSVLTADPGRGKHAQKGSGWRCTRPRGASPPCPPPPVASGRAVGARREAGTEAGSAAVGAGELAVTR